MPTAALVDTRLQPRVDRFENAPIERDEVRHERDRHAKLLLYFGRVPVREHAVSRDAVVALGEVRPLGRRLPGARHTGLGVDDDPGLHETCGDERLQRQYGGSRIAPGARDEPRTRKILAVSLGQSVGKRHVNRRRVRIPTLPELGVSQPEGAGEIEDSGAPACQDGHDLRSQGLRDRQEDGVRLTTEFVHIERHRHRVPDPGQRRDFPCLRAAGSHSHPDIGRGMPGQPTQQLDAGIAGSSCDADPDARKIIHRNE